LEMKKKQETHEIPREDPTYIVTLKSKRGKE
jgi:hypothetical protein